jgi:hypothetical protein
MSWNTFNNNLSNQLFDWAGTEQNRVKASTLIRIAENLERRWLEYRFPKYKYVPCSSSLLAKCWGVNKPKSL